MIKPKKLSVGDKIATVSPSLGCAGDEQIIWKYRLGVRRLEELGLRVVPAPNSLKGSEYLDKNPMARAEDLMWAFENKYVKAIISNIGGNDSERLLPYLDSKIIKENPKIFCGYSDVMTLHIYFYRLGLSSFYGDNLLTTVAEAENWHEYSKYWFKKLFFSSDEIGDIPPSYDWSFSKNNHERPSYKKLYIPNRGYKKVQGEGIVRGKLFGGHCGLIEYSADSIVAHCKSDYDGSILFIEDIPEICTPEYFGNFLDTLGKCGYLQVLNGIIIGKMSLADDFDNFENITREIISKKYGCHRLPVMSGLNFGHSSPICILPYGAEAELDIENLKFSISENATI